MITRNCIDFFSTTKFTTFTRYCAHKYE